MILKKSCSLCSIECALHLNTNVKLSVIKSKLAKWWIVAPWKWCGKTPVKGRKAEQVHSAWRSLCEFPKPWRWWCSMWKKKIRQENIRNREDVFRCLTLCSRIEVLFTFRRCKMLFQNGGLCFYWVNVSITIWWRKLKCIYSLFSWLLWENMRDISAFSAKFSYLCKYVPVLYSFLQAKALKK